MATTISSVKFLSLKLSVSILHKEIIIEINAITVYLNEPLTHHPACGSASVLAAIAVPAAKQQEFPVTRFATCSDTPC
ncbi:hypothetical protein [Nitrosomonas sp.]|uniref:hypothetical protein n=1 Tax=Nitrosomonas sp. TaxID=42353 RepID=UPI00271A93E8|nr:hypothetical protein [Nitrosomonas sp.]MDO8893371.1 hypothetical protein [Nitrosomonas sp.]MDP1788377.1 hypothetical protein [Nitrosomonas sp.]MDP2223572.1 hypothetical protein [Nitrosomonas sp.]